MGIGTNWLEKEATLTLWMDLGASAPQHGEGKDDPMALPSSYDGAHPVTAPARPSLDDASHYLAALQDKQANARYPALLRLGERDQGVLFRQEHPKAGLITVAVEQAALPGPLLRALGEFRLQQFLLCGWYEAARALADQAQTDPQLTRVPASSVHLLTGTPEGQILAYCLLQAAAQEEGERPRAAETRQYLHEFPRALFPAERELFGPVLFASLPALRTIPLEHLGDFTCLLQNQALHSPLRTIAVINAILSMIHLLSRPSSRWQAILGNMNQEARALLAQLGVPVLYAPEAQVVVHSLPYHHYWAEEEIGPLAQGKYWPFVVAVDDLRAHQEHFEELHQAFAGELGDIRRAVVVRRRKQTPVAPLALVPAAGTKAAQVWASPTTLKRKSGTPMSILPGSKKKDDPLPGSVAVQTGTARPPAAPMTQQPGEPVQMAEDRAPADALGQRVDGRGAAPPRYKVLSFDLLQLAVGMQVLDVGCGDGTDLPALAEHVGAEGLVVGVDHDPHLIQAAYEAHHGRGNVRVLLAPAEHLPFAHRSFDALRADRLLQAVPDPAAVLKELWRVLKPEGVMTLVEPDWHAVTLYPASPAGGDDAHTLHAVLQRTCPHPLIGRRLYSLLHQGGMWDQIEMRVETLVFTSWKEADALLLLSKTAQTLAGAEQQHAEDIHAWLQAVETAAERGEFFGSLPLFFATARRARPSG